MPLTCNGRAVQAGLLVCTSLPHQTLIIADGAQKQARRVRTGSDGRATIGLLRSEASRLHIRIDGQDAPALSLDIASRNDPVARLLGLDCDKIDARTPEQVRHAERSWVLKQGAFETFSTGPGASAGFRSPAPGPISSPFGPERHYSGISADGQTCEKTSIHQGYDIAAPIGTPISAPAPGTVLLAEPDLYYEGGTVFLDHGDGLVSVFMHMSQVDVVAGTEVAKGEQLGASGNTGRTTGPHVHWAVKWRNSSDADRSGDFYIDPALLLELEPSS